MRLRSEVHKTSRGFPHHVLEKKFYHLFLIWFMWQVSFACFGFYQELNYERFSWHFSEISSTQVVAPVRSCSTMSSWQPLLFSELPFMGSQQTIKQLCPKHWSRLPGLTFSTFYPIISWWGQIAYFSLWNEFLHTSSLWYLIVVCLGISISEWADIKDVYL